MVNLKDGSVLIAYYEEREGSNIKERQMKPTSTTLLFCVLLVATTTSAQIQRPT